MQDPPNIKHQTYTRTAQRSHASVGLAQQIYQHKNSLELALHGISIGRAAIRGRVSIGRAALLGQWLQVAVGVGGKFRTTVGLAPVPTHPEQRVPCLAELGPLPA